MLPFFQNVALFFSQHCRFYFTCSHARSFLLGILNARKRRTCHKTLWHYGNDRDLDRARSGIFYPERCIQRYVGGLQSGMLLVSSWIYTTSRSCSFVKFIPRGVLLSAGYTPLKSYFRDAKIHIPRNNG